MAFIILLINKYILYLLKKMLCQNLLFYFWEIELPKIVWILYRTDKYAQKRIIEYI